MNAKRPWHTAYPAGMPTSIDLSGYESLVSMIEDNLTEFADRPAYDLMGKTITFSDLDRMSMGFAAFLQSQGLKRGDRVAIMLPNVLHYPVAMIGALRAGMVVVNVNPLYTPRELRHQLVDSGSVFLVILKDFLATFDSIKHETLVRKAVIASIDEIPVFDSFEINERMEGPDWVSFGNAVARGANAPFERPRLDMNDIAVLQYTGGTTGISKGAALTHGNLVGALKIANLWAEPALAKKKVTGQMNVVCALPLYHVFAFIACALMGLRFGALNILVPNPRDAAGMIKNLTRFKLHMFPAVNTLFNAMINTPEFANLDFSEMVLCNGGGAAVQEVVARKWLDVTGAPIVEGYGLSETCALATCNRSDVDAFTGTIGLPVPSIDIRILDDDEKDVAVGASGEIAIKGPPVMSGYWNRPGETRAVMTADGYFKTGDIGTMDSHGYIRIVDRKKDMIIVSGFNVYPNEIEAVIAAHPRVLECAVVGVPDDKTGEAVLAFVVPNGEVLTADEIKVFCKDKLTGYKSPKRIEFRKELPKTNVGKILRRELRDAAIKELTA